MRYLLILALALSASAQTMIFGGGGGASIFKPRGATLPASCAIDGLVFVLTATDGGNARGSYVCVNGTYAPMGSTGGTGNMVNTGTPAATALPKYSDTSGTAIAPSGVTVDASNNMVVPGTITSGDGTVAGSVVLNELTANGSNHRTFKVPDALTASLTFALPDSVPTAGQVMAFSAPSADVSTISWITPITANQKIGAVGITIDGGGSAITTGNKGCVPVEYAGTITQATALADQSGSIVVDVWKDTYANYPPTDADSITASAPVTLSTAIKAQDATLTGWTKTISAGDVVCFNVDSAATVTRVTLSLKVTKD